MDKKKIILVFEVVFAILTLSVIGGSYGSVMGGEINVIDEGQLASWAYQMTEGKKLFRDIYTTYGPLFTFPLYWLFQLFGPHLYLVRAYLLLGSLLGCLVSVYFLYKLKVRFILRILVLFFLSALPVMTIRQAMGFVILLFLYRYITSHSSKDAFFVGIFIAIAFLVSPEIALFVSFIVFVYVVTSIIRSKNVSETLLKSSFIPLGFVTVFSIFTIWSVHEGWFRDYLYVTSDVFSSFSGMNLPNGQRFPSPNMIFSEVTTPISFVRAILSKDALLYAEILFYIGSIFALVVFFYRKKFQSEEIIVLLFISLGLLLYSILLSRHGLGHFYFTLSPLIVLSSYFIHQILNQKYAIYRKNFIPLIIIVSYIALFHIRIIMIQRYEIVENFTSTVRALTVDVPKFTPERYQKMRFDSFKELINQYSGEDDYIFIFSDQPLVYFLAERKNATRYDLPYIANTASKRFEIVNDMKLKKPKLILYDLNTWEVDGIGNKERLPEVNAFIKEHYTLEETRKGIEVYVLN